MKLVMSGKYKVDVIDDNNQEFEVLFHGPQDSSYEGVSYFHPLSPGYASLLHSFESLSYQPSSHLLRGEVTLRPW
jgi:hypothetical protein